jgi:alanine dehydrogenase
VHVIQAATRYANEALRKRLYQAGVPGVSVKTLDYDLTTHPEIVQTILEQTDILVDATQRPDTSAPVIRNTWLGHLPHLSVLLDLSVDPYNCAINPVSVKGIEGIPQGNLDQYIFSPEDPAYDRIPACVDTSVRRWAVSCYSWPGIYPAECMQLYGRQLRPIINRIIDLGGIENISSNGRYFERAIARAVLANWPNTTGNSA